MESLGDQYVESRDGPKSSFAGYPAISKTGDTEFLVVYPVGAGYRILGNQISGHISGKLDI